MKKNINGKEKKNNKLIIKVTVILIFLFFIISVLVLSDRKYLYIESSFKTFSSNINAYFVNKIYSNNNISGDVIKSKIKVYEKENNELKKILDLKQTSEKYIAVQITNRTSEDFFNKIIISKGTNNGIKKGYPVIGSNGLVGFISKTSNHISEVNLLTNVSKNNMISVFIEQEDELISGFLAGYDRKMNLFKITDVTTKKQIKKDTKVILSGYNNELYKGIYVGKIVKEEDNNYGLSKTLWLKSDVNFDDILYLLVLKEE